MTSTGDLQIVQLHRTDSGTYVCIADNGVGSEVTREVVLDVTGMFLFMVVFVILWINLIGFGGKVDVFFFNYLSAAICILTIFVFFKTNCTLICFS